MSAAFEASRGATTRLHFSHETRRAFPSVAPHNVPTTSYRSSSHAPAAASSGAITPTSSSSSSSLLPAPSSSIGAHDDAPSLFQLVAVAGCYPTMVSVWMWLPKNVWVVPVLVVGAARAVTCANNDSSRAMTATATQILGLLLLLVLCVRWTMVTAVNAVRRRHPTTTTTPTPQPSSSFSRKPSPSSSSTAPSPRILLFFGGAIVVVVVAAIMVRAGAANGRRAPSSPQTSSSSFVGALVSAAVAAGRVSAAAALLGWVVLGRYLGPKSYRRMSSCLLVMNPVGEVVWTLWNRPMAIFGPGDGHDGVLILGGLFSLLSSRKRAYDQSDFVPGSKTTTTTTRAPGATGPPSRSPRYLYVTVTTLVAQLVVAVVVGGIVTLLIRPALYVPAGDASRSSTLFQVQALLAGVSAVTISLLGTVVDGFAPSSASSSSSSSPLPPQELSPGQCFATHRRLEALGDNLSRFLRRSVVVGVLSSATSAVLTSSRVMLAVVKFASLFPGMGNDRGSGGAEDVSSSVGATFGFGMVLAAYGAVVALYLSVLDECVQIALFDRLRSVCSDPSSGQMDDLIEGLDTAAALARPGARRQESRSYKDDGGGARSIPSRKLEVVLTALLQSEELVREVVSRRPHGGYDNEPGRVEREERRLVISTAGKLGDLLIDPSGVLSHSEAPWEEDVLRAAMMHALASGSITEAWFGGRQGQIQRAIGIDERRRVDQFYPMFLVPLVRALCVNVRGMGDALLKSSSPTRGGTPYGLGSGAALQRWHMPPGFEFAAQCSLEALSSYLAQSLVEMSQVTGWKSTLISPFVPLGLSSMHCMRRGLLAFEVPPPVHVDSDESDGVLVAQNPTVSKLVQACDDCALRVVASIQLPPGHPLASRNSLRLEEECSLWVTSLLTAQVNKST